MSRASWLGQWPEQAMCLQVEIKYIHSWVCNLATCLEAHANQLQGMKEKETWWQDETSGHSGYGCGGAMPPMARKQQLAALYCPDWSGHSVRLPMPATLHFIWCSNRSPRAPASADADHASRRTHNRSPVLSPLYLQASAYLLSSLIPRATTATSSTFVLPSSLVAIRWCSRSPACRSCCWASLLDCRWPQQSMSFSYLVTSRVLGCLPQIRLAICGAKCWASLCWGLLTNEGAAKRWA